MLWWRALSTENVRSPFRLATIIYSKSAQFWPTTALLESGSKKWYARQTLVSQASDQNRRQGSGRWGYSSGHVGRGAPHGDLGGGRGGR